MKKWDERYQDFMVDMFDLWKRGWTERMIEKLLGEPSWIESGWADRSKRAYSAVQVEAVESGTTFREHFLASARRRKLDKKRVEEVMNRSLELEQQGAAAVWQARVEEMRLAKEREMKEYEERRLAREKELEAKRQALEAIPKPPLPPSQLVCLVVVETMFEDWSTSIRFMRHEGIDRVYCDEKPSMKAEQETQGTAAESVATLLPRVLFTLMQFGGSLKFDGAGLVDGRMFAEIVEEIGARSAKIRDNNLERANTAIVSAARELGLRPEPSSKSEDCWEARCPGTQHGLLLNTSLDEFWCGYCRRSGDLIALRSFANERRK